MSEVEKPTLLEDEIPQNFQIGKIRFTLFRLLLLLTLAGILGELVFFAWIWPDWAELHRGKVPASALIKDYQAQLKENPKLPALVWMPVQKAFPNRIKKAFILSEDSRFYEHGGVDFQAIQDAIKYNWKHGKILLGASTISQQTAKNMFLSLSRSPLRKGNELLLTWLLEARLSKAEILHIYLNIAEFGTGIFGIEAAARTYYHTSAYN
ncbi:MAG: transglycosylase domain-containing protein, partial [Proteobacteria bacterium]|nr:transglycosylase domain-containing protein [Pseudomonadota bacterium]